MIGVETGYLTGITECKKISSLKIYIELCSSIQSLEMFLMSQFLMKLLYWFWCKRYDRSFILRLLCKKLLLFLHSRGVILKAFASLYDLIFTVHHESWEKPFLSSFIEFTFDLRIFTRCNAQYVESCERKLLFSTESWYISPIFQ